MDNNKLKNRISSVINTGIYTEYPKFPQKGMLIEVTNLCNDSCIFCFNKNMVREKGFIDSNFTFRILKEAYDLGMREVGFYTTGEPLLNKDIGSYIEAAKKLGYSYIYITTNGFFADINTVKDLIEKGLNSIKFSINAINETDYSFIHGKNDFNRVTENLKQVYEYKTENCIDLNVFVSYIKTKYTDIQVDEIKKYFADICDEVVVMNAENQGGLMPEISELLLCSGDTELDTTKKLPCSYPFKSVVITKEGYLTACCLDFQNYLAYADLNQTSLKEAWHCKTITEFRRKQLQCDSGNTICTNCIYNKNVVPEPLLEELATKFEYNDSKNKECVVKRIDKYLIKSLNNIK